MANIWHLLSIPIVSLVAAATFPTERLVQAADRARAASGVHCEIREITAQGDTELQAVAIAEQDVRGQYDFVVKSQSGGGTSNVSQGGEFVLRQGEEQVLGVVSVQSGGPPAHKSRLQIKDSQGKLLCEDETT